MAKVLDLTESTYKIITDYASSIGIKGRVTEKQIAQLGFSGEVFDKDGAVYPLSVRQELAEAYNRGRSKQDFSEFLSIIAHKEAQMDKRGDGDFEATFRAIAPQKSLFDFTGNQGNSLENYNEKALALSSLVNTRFLTNGKLAKMVKKGEIAPAQFWELMSSANYTETSMKQAVPYLDSLRGAQRNLLKNARGLKNDKEAAPYDYMVEFLEKVGVVLDEESLGKLGIDDVTLEDAITGKLATGKYLETEIQRQQKEAEEEGSEADTDIKVTKGTFNKRSRHPDEGHLSNSAIRAQMLAGKQTYSVLVAPLVKKAVGLLNSNPREGLQIGNISPEYQASLEEILPLTEKERLADVFERVGNYGEMIYSFLHPEENKAFNNKMISLPQGEVKAAELARENLETWLERNFSANIEEYSYEQGLAKLSEKLNKSCIIQGAYAESNQADFLKSLVVASSSQRLGLDLDQQLECQMGNMQGYIPNDINNPQFSTEARKLYLPLTLVTDGGMYKTSVEYTEEIYTLLSNNRSPEDFVNVSEKLLETAINNVKKLNPQANLRHLTAENLIVGSNPVMAQVQDFYEEHQKELTELKLGKSSGSFNAKRYRDESLPLLYRDLPIYQQYKQQAARSIQGFIFVPMHKLTQTRELPQVAPEPQGPSGPTGAPAPTGPTVAPTGPTIGTTGPTAPTGPTAAPTGPTGVPEPRRENSHEPIISSGPKHLEPKPTVGERIRSLFSRKEQREESAPSEDRPIVLDEDVSTAGILSSGGTNSMNEMLERHAQERRDLYSSRGGEFTQIERDHPSYATYRGQLMSDIKLGCRVTQDTLDYYNVTPEELESNGLTQEDVLVLPEETEASITPREGETFSDIAMRATPEQLEESTKFQPLVGEPSGQGDDGGPVQ